MTQEYDYIVVGAGSAGCPVAARLSEKPDISVLLLEAGGPDNNIWFRIPLGVGKLLHNSRYVWPFMTEPEPGLFGQSVYWPRGKVLGGSSSINGMAYVRGMPEEYDYWQELGNAGWSYANVSPYFKRLENYPTGDPGVRGQSGPMRIENREAWDPDPLSDAFIAACQEAGIPYNPDYNAGPVEGVSYLQQTCWKGRRWSTATGYLALAKNRPNLTVKTEALVARVLFEGIRAVGIEYDRHGSRTQVRARGEIILCAGAIRSPQLLELSGVGDFERLKSLGIQPVYHLPGVGESLQDHLQVRFTYSCSQPITINDLINSPFMRIREGIRYIFSRRGLLSTTSSTAHALARTGPLVSSPNVKIQIALISGKDRYSRSRDMGLDLYSGFSVGVFPLHPKSRGSLHIKSDDPKDPPKIHANYLSHPDDVHVYLDAFRLIRRIMSQDAILNFVRDEKRPGPDVTDDDQLLDYVRQTGQTSWHSISTCRMGTDEMAVVDSRLRVRGIEGLRIIDASIMPTMASSNTNAPAIMIGEKGADLVLEDLRKSRIT